MSMYVSVECDYMNDDEALEAWVMECEALNRAEKELNAQREYYDNLEE